MRVIAGSKRHFGLKTVPGKNTRPTQDRIKETLFNILQTRIYGTRFLDLFAGSGGIGIEALSRGAEFAVFVDNSKEAVKTIEENLAHTEFTEQSLVFSKDIKASLRAIEKLEPFDIIFIDPPYFEGYEREVLEYLASSSIVKEDTLIIMEADLHTKFDFLEEIGLKAVRVKEYKTNMHVFIEKM
ncbi:MAG: 16S rRNA (guanine(966)-N(2))-methyltransferase RsmD [Eubacterium sp.]|nr:16S rRNA (guanine(966)-N(2))-methyltransferase RsmD [Eubacterium sp.]